MMKKTPIFLPVSCRRGTAILLTALLLTGCGGSADCRHEGFHTAGARPTDGRIRDVWQ